MLFRGSADANGVSVSIHCCEGETIATVGDVELEIAAKAAAHCANFRSPRAAKKCVAGITLIRLDVHTPKRKGARYGVI